MRRRLCWLAAVVVCLALSSSAAGARLLAEDEMPLVSAPSAGGDLASAAAPAPGSALPPADILFAISAASASLTEDKLTLNGVAGTVVHTTRTNKAGVDTTASFANATADSKMVARDGRWLGNPVAVMHSANGSALLHLASPEYDPAAGTLTFQSKILPAATSAGALTTSDGVVARYVDEAGAGAAADALTEPPDGELTNVALFIDQAQQDLGTEAVTKYWAVVIGGGGWGGWGWGGWGWHGGWGWGWHHW